MSCTRVPCNGKPRGPNTRPVRGTAGATTRITSALGRRFDVVRRVRKPAPAIGTAAWPAATGSSNAPSASLATSTAGSRSPMSVVPGLMARRCTGTDDKG